MCALVTLLLFPMVATAQGGRDSVVVRSTLIGVVVVDSIGTPITGAEVTLMDLPKTVLTDDRGEFRFTNIPVGSHRLRVRRLGYGFLDATVVIANAASTYQRVVLSPIVTLDSIVTIATPFDRAMADFEENRKVGLGHFFTRAEMAKMENRSFPTVMRELPGAKVITAPVGLSASAHYYLASSRGRKSLTEANCYAHIYVDGRPEYTGKPGEELFDLGTISPDRIEAVEYYTSAAETPMKYSTLNARCGVLVIWLRRT